MTHTYPDDFINKILQGNCLEIMQYLPDKCVDMVLCDLPYGTTACKWDTIIPFGLLWKQHERIIKDSAAIVLTSSQPFTTKLVNSRIEYFKYSWIWEKDQGVNFQLCKYQPLKIHEDVCVFSKTTHKYYPQDLVRVDKKSLISSKVEILGTNQAKSYGLNIHKSSHISRSRL